VAAAADSALRLCLRIEAEIQATLEQQAALSAPERAVAASKRWDGGIGSIAHMPVRKPAASCAGAAAACRRLPQGHPDCNGAGGPCAHSAAAAKGVVGGAALGMQAAACPAEPAAAAGDGAAWRCSADGLRPRGRPHGSCRHESCGNSGGRSSWCTAAHTCLQQAAGMCLLPSAQPPAAAPAQTAVSSPVGAAGCVAEAAARLTAAHGTGSRAPTLPAASAATAPQPASAAAAPQPPLAAGASAGQDVAQRRA